MAAAGGTVFFVPVQHVDSFTVTAIMDVHHKRNSFLLGDKSLCPDKHIVPFRQKIHNEKTFTIFDRKVGRRESVEEQHKKKKTGSAKKAALSNLLGAQLADQGYFDTENIYVYTFAAPNVSQQEKVSDPKYNFIWNIINPEDIVPTVPLKTSGKKKEWNYGKFGQSKVFANYWNTDPFFIFTITDEYIPGVNKYFSQIMRRDYYPFKTGTYIPSLVTRILSDLYHNVNEFYDAPISLRNQAEKIFYKIYPEETELENTEAEETEKEENHKEQKKDRGLFATIGKSINKSTGGFLDYSEFAFFDMHCCSNYLSWLLALDENKAFSDKKSSRLIIHGAYECAVFDSQENMVLKIADGIPKLKSIKIPILAVPFPYGTVIGFPSNQNYSVVIYKDSILPTPIPLKIEHYDEEGYVTEVCPKKYVYPHKGIAYTFIPASTHARSFSVMLG